MLKLLFGEIQRAYSEGGCIREADREVLYRTRKCLLVRGGQYAQLISMLYDTGIVELLSEKPKENNGLFNVPKDRSKKRQLILDEGRAEYHFIETEYAELPRPGLFLRLEKAEKEELSVRKLHIDNFDHC